MGHVSSAKNFSFTQFTVCATLQSPSQMINVKEKIE